MLVLGGNVNFLGCACADNKGVESNDKLNDLCTDAGAPFNATTGIMYRFIPYGLPIINNIQIGRDILVLAGNCVLVGFYK